MASVTREQGFYSLVRWVPDATRNEARNVAVILVEPEGRFRRLLHAPLSRISSRLADQGVMDALLDGIDRRLRNEDAPFTLSELQGLAREQSGDAMVVTAPHPTAVTDPDQTIDALYSALVKPRGGGQKGMTKGRLLDRVVERLRREELPVRRGYRLGGFLFDAVVDVADKPVAIEVLSFNHPRKIWTAVEHDAGHFLLGTMKVGARPAAVVESPGAASQAAAYDAHTRVMGWFADGEVNVVDPVDMRNPTEALHLGGFAGSAAE